MTGRRVLVVTLPPYSGGVPAKTRLLVDLLKRRGHDVTVAYYATLSDEPALGAPTWRIPLGARPQAEARQCFGGTPAIAVGTWLPELEFTYYWPSRRWRDVIGRHDRHIATGGTVLASYPLLASGVPHVIWCASTMIEDRRERRAAMPPWRRLFDQAVIGPVQAAMERRILSGSARLQVTSEHTRRQFAALGRAISTTTLMPVPVDSAHLTPRLDPPTAGVIGFAGRIADPRKNVTLLLEAFAQAHSTRSGLRLRLTGDATEPLRVAVRRLGLEAAVEFVGHLPELELPDFYRSLDVFVIPSRQEGFGIVGIEAMACGVPVISTRCGGPEDFVAHGRNGFLTGFDASEMAGHILELIADRARRQQMSMAARLSVVENYSLERFEHSLETAWQAVWQEAL